MSKPSYLIVLTLGLLGLGSWMALAAHEAGANNAPAARASSDCRSTEKARRDCAARDLCQSEFGAEALHFWTPEGHLVCRRGSQQ